MVYNAGRCQTNTFKGEGSYLFRRNAFSAFPFFLGTGVASTCGDAPAGSVLPATKVDTGTADVGGPIIKNKAFFYAGWEQTRRDLSSTSLITITPANAAAIGLAPQPAAVPNVQTGKFLIAKGDLQLNSANRATVRWLRFHNDAPYNSGGGLSSLEWATNFLDAMDSVAGQVVSTLGSNKLNEFRVQYAHRHQSTVRNSDSGTGPAVSFSGIANFGSPLSGPGRATRASTSSRTSPRRSTISPTSAPPTATSSASTTSTFTTNGPRRRSSSTRSRQSIRTSRPRTAPTGSATRR
jgi:hypothetical protein